MPKRRTNRGRRRRKTQASHRLIQRLKRMHRKQPRRKRKMRKRRKKRLKRPLTPHQSSTIQRALVRGWYIFGNTSSPSLMEKAFTVLKSKSFRVKQNTDIEMSAFLLFNGKFRQHFSKSYNLFDLQLYYLTSNYSFFVIEE